MTLREFSLALTGCELPIKIFTLSDETDKECFANDEALWKRAKEDKEFGDQEVRWFSVTLKFVKVRIK